jgi:hypothetical protein
MEESKLVAPSIAYRSQSVKSDRVQTPLTLALKRHREQFSPFKISHIDKTGKTVRFIDPKTRGTSFDINNYAMPYNPNRMCHVNVQLAIADPTQTIT